MNEPEFETRVVQYSAPPEVIREGHRKTVKSSGESSYPLSACEPRWGLPRILLTPGGPIRPSPVASILPIHTCTT